MSGYVPASLRRKVAEYFANCCAYCRTAESLTVAIFECEHIIPRSAGGQTVLDNLCLACPTCNRYKADRVAAIDPDTQAEVHLFLRTVIAGPITFVGPAMQRNCCL